MADQNNATSLEDAQKALVAELGLADLPQEKQEQLLVRMTEVVLARIFVETMDKLSEHDQETYNSLIEREATPEELQKFLTEKIVNYDEMVKKIVDEFKEEMKNVN
jgi:hypothetical protein